MEKEATGGIPLELLYWAIPALAAAVVLYVAWKVLSRRRRQPPPEMPDLTLDIATLGEAGPPAGSPMLEYYHLPVRLAAVVLAPAGRMGQVPEPERVGETLDALVPGLSHVFHRHQPPVRFWPAQMSPRGFAHAFFGYARLPGDGGKGTHWCSLAGVFKVQGQPVMAGFIFRTAAPTNLGQGIIEQETKWLDVLRLRRNG
jgi:hypothetical protein